VTTLAYIDDSRSYFSVPTVNCRVGNFSTSPEQANLTADPVTVVFRAALTLVSSQKVLGAYKP